MTSFREFSLDRERMAEGKRVETLDMFGKKNGHWLLIRNGYDDEVLLAIERAERKIARDPEGSALSAKRMARSSIVMGWSFEDDVTPDAVEEFLYDQPWNADLIDNEAGNQKRFFSKPVASSLNGQKKKSPSKKAPTVTVEQSATT